jgi:uncharacterized membrane protein YhaH (DUF805 family)
MTVDNCALAFSFENSVLISAEPADRVGSVQLLKGVVMDFGYLYTSFEGRINRKPYWLATIVLVVVGIVVVLALMMTVASTGGFTSRLILAVVQLAFLYPSTALMVKRLHDRNRPGYFAAFMLAPLLLNMITDLMGITGDPLNQNALDYLLGGITFLVGIWFFIELGCLRGTVGPNQYGPDPLAPAVGAAAR